MSPLELDRWIEPCALLVLAGIACVLAAVIVLALAVWLVAPGKRRRRAPPINLKSAVETTDFTEGTDSSRLRQRSRFTRRRTKMEKKFS
ncbi:MAG: hypothetical protein HYV96_04035 [Opitutae bacterium]|nr:hypothetical protein [Opitutae bacterium]